MFRILNILFFLFLWSNIFPQNNDPFKLYVEKNSEWYPAIYQLYIQQYADIHVNRYLIDPQDNESIKMALEQFPHKITKDFDVVLDAVQDGKKVFFFIDNFAWGGIDIGSTYSGLWNRLMPVGSGFYLHKKKCFQKQGLNYLCKPENANTLEFWIML